MTPFSPGARQLLAEAEATAERGLHLARAILWVVLTVIFFFVFGITRNLPWGITAAVVAVFVFGVVGWIWIWRMIIPGRRPALKYLLILLDGWVIARPAIYLVVIPPIFADFGLTSADVLAATPPLLVYLALSGAFRIDPWVAIFSTATALFAFTVIAVSTTLPVREALAIGSVIVFSGVFGTYVARVLRDVALRARQEEILERYVPMTLTRDLARTGHPETVGHQAEVTILVADIRGFTHLTEHLPPAAAVALLNDYFTVVVAPLVAEDGIIDAYIGDGLLAHFEGDDRGQRALRGAQEMQAALDRFNAGRSEYPPIEIGIALHAGPVLVGTIGAPGRQAYTLIGDAVNVTDRLEKHNKELGSILIASVDALAGLDDLDRAGFEGPRLVEVRGHDEPIAVHYLSSSRNLG